MTDERRKITESFTQELPVLRKMCRWSQTDLANKIGITRATISSIEVGKHPMTWTVFLACLTVFERNETVAQYIRHRGIVTEDVMRIIDA